MNFDDYSYKGLNDLILVEEPRDIEKRKLDVEQRMKIQSFKENQSKLTDHSLSEKKDVYEFKHDIITLEPSKKELKELEEKQKK